MLQQVLPGMEATDALPMPIARALAPDVPTRAVTYPTRGGEDYERTLPLVQPAVADVSPSAVLGMSSSGALAIRIAADRPDALRAFVSAATFATSPLPDPAGAARCRSSRRSRCWPRRSQATPRTAVTYAGLHPARAHGPPHSLGPILVNLQNPPILFFPLGVLATLMRADLQSPSPITKLLALCLPWAIGFNGGVELVRRGLDDSTDSALAVGLIRAFAIPLHALAIARRFCSVHDAVTLAATYGSASAVSF